MPDINDNETMPRPVLPPPGSALDAEDWQRASGASGAGGGRHEGLPVAESRRAAARRAAGAPPFGQAPGPGGDGTLEPRDQLVSGDADLPPAWAPGETAERINGRRIPPGRHSYSNPGNPI